MRHLFPLASALLLALAPAAFSASPTPPAFPHFTTIPQMTRADAAKSPYAHAPASPEKILAMSPADAYTQLMVILANGNQSSAETLVKTLAAKCPNDQPLAFLRAVCARSRFDVDAAIPLFSTAEQINPDTPEGHCAANILRIDHNVLPAKSLAALIALADAHPDKPLIEWTAAIACRTLDQNADGIRCYGKLFKTLYPGVGTALMHQTCANVLDENRDFQEAYFHRQITVKIEPAGWSYQGLANTLNSLGQYTEADQAYAKAIALDPTNTLYWQTWGNCLLRAGRYDDADAKYQEATTLDPACATAWQEWGSSLEAQHNPQDALKKYRHALQLNPRDTYSHDRIAYLSLSTNQRTSPAQSTDRASSH